MPTIITSVPVATVFNVTPSTKKIQLYDINGVGGVYAFSAIPLAGVKGNFKITAPDGTVIHNNTSLVTPDIDGGTTITWAFEILIPTNADGTFVAGNYSIVYTVNINDGSNPVYNVVFNASYNFQYTSPEVAIVQTVDCLTPNFTSVDDTNYTVNAVLPTTLARTHTLNFPFGSAGEGSPIVSATDTISTGTFYQGTQTTEISTVLVYTYPVTTGVVPTFQVKDTVTGAKEVKVDCTFICKIVCCIRSLYNRTESYRGVNEVLFCESEATFNYVMSLVELAFLSIDCGKANDVNTYLSKIQTLANCTDDCSCNDGAASLVVGLGGVAGISVVVSGGAPITVTGVTVGTTTTYTITFDPTLVTKINNAYNTIVVGDSGVSVTDSGVVAGVRTFTLNSSALYKDRLEFKVTMTWANSVVSPANVIIAISDVVVFGTKFQAPSIESYDNLNLNWKNLNNTWRLYDFYTSSPSDNYKITFSSSTESFASGTPLTDAQKFTFISGRQGYVYADLFSRTLKSLGEVYFRFLLTNNGGSVLCPTNGGLNRQKQILSFVITE
jgi:hypothetical protein